MSVKREASGEASEPADRGPPRNVRRARARDERVELARAQAPSVRKANGVRARARISSEPPLAGNVLNPEVLDQVTSKKDSWLKGYPFQRHHVGRLPYNQ